MKKLLEENKSVTKLLTTPDACPPRQNFTNL